MGREVFFKGEYVVGNLWVGWRRKSVGRCGWGEEERKKSEIRISKSETNSNYQNANFKTAECGSPIAD